MLNRYPYTNGHLMIAPVAHEARLFDSSDASLRALLGLTAEAQRILCNMPNWRPTAALVATEKIFSDERAERRQLPFAIRTINVSAIEVRIADLERADRRAKLLRDIKATPESPAYLFLAVETNGLIRYYPIRLGAL